MDGDDDNDVDVYVCVGVGVYVWVVSIVFLLHTGHHPSVQLGMDSSSAKETNA